MYQDKRIYARHRDKRRINNTKFEDIDWKENKEMTPNDMGRRKRKDMRNTLKTENTRWEIILKNKERLSSRLDELKVKEK